MVRVVDEAERDEPAESDAPCDSCIYLGVLFRCVAVVAIVVAGAEVVAARAKVYGRSNYAFAFTEPNTHKYIRFLDRDSTTAPTNYSARAFVEAYQPAAPVGVERCTNEDLTRLYLGKVSKACSYGSTQRACRAGFGLDAASGDFVGCDGGFFCPSPCGIIGARRE